MEFQFLKKLHSYTTAFASHELFHELKTLIYETEDRQVIEDKERALRCLFAGMDRAEEKKWESARSLIQEALNLFQKHQDLLREGFCHYFMGELFLTQENWPDALQSYETSWQMLSDCRHRMAYAVEKKLQETRHRMDHI